MTYPRMRRVCSIQGAVVIAYVIIRRLAVMLAERIVPLFHPSASPLGWGYWLAIAIGLAVVLFWKKRDFCFRSLWKSVKPMGVGSLMRIGTVFVSGQILYLVLSTFCEQFLGLLGFNYGGGRQISSDSLSLLLYVGLGAPLAEELLFRGVVLRALQPCGKKFAVLASAILFAGFHGNFAQGIYAFFIALLLGYVTVEYGIVWAMGLHVFNNLILGEVLPKVGAFFGVGDLLFWGFVLLSGIAAAVVLIRRRRYIGVYLWDGDNAPLCWHAFFTSPGILAFMILMTISAVLLALNII